MAQLVRSAFNRGGSWQSDGLDQGDAARFNRAGQNQDNDLMRQLALAQLQSGDARFGAERQDRQNAQAAQYGFMNKQLDQGTMFHNQDREDSTANRTAMLGYQTGRDAAADKRYQTEWDYSKSIRDEDAPLREAARKRDLAAGMLSDMNIEDLKAQHERQRTAQAGGVPYAARTSEGRLAQKGAALSGADLGVQGVAAESADLPALQQSAEIEAQSVASDLGAIENKASSIKPWQALGSPEIAAVQQRLTNLEKMYTDAGMSPQDAHNKVQQLARSVMPKSHTILFGENPATAIYKHLGMQLPN